jgi:suppressor of tumorigenicity protein 13
VTDAMLEQADAKRGEAQAKLSEGAFEEAISLFTQAIENNPQSAILYAKRAQCYIKLQKLMKILNKHLNGEEKLIGRER